MRKLRIEISRCSPVRRGREWFWSLLLEKTAAGASVTFADILDHSDQDQGAALQDFFTRLRKAGVVERSEMKPFRYRLLQRQPDCPIIRADGRVIAIGTGRQNMWNVMRRSRGFTVPQLAVDASTDDVAVSRSAAQSYVYRLHIAGLLNVIKPGLSGSPQVYVLRGTANTGPKAPRLHKAAIVYDANTGKIVGQAMSEEESR